MIERRCNKKSPFSPHLAFPLCHHFMTVQEYGQVLLSVTATYSLSGLDVHRRYSIQILCALISCFGASVLIKMVVPVLIYPITLSGGGMNTYLFNTFYSYFVFSLAFLFRWHLPRIHLGSKYLEQEETFWLVTVSSVSISLCSNRSNFLMYISVFGSC